MGLQLNSKTALVSGSTAGIGYAIAEALAREGTGVIVNGRTQAAVDQAVARLKAAGGMVAYVCSPLASATTGAALRVDGGTLKSAF